MNMSSINRRALWLLALACLLPLPFCAGALLVNVEIAIRVFCPTFHYLDRILPEGLYHVWAVLSADLSTVSTLIPVMILAFPLGQALRILRLQDSDPTFAQRLGPDPYPSHFGFFQVMLGLTGTLYGMYIGLDVSGVSELAVHGPTQDTIRQSLDRLLGGTATALLSSLVGLIGAFITARPVPWIFGRVTGVKADETRQTLTATIERLTDDLRGLSQASRGFADILNPDTARHLLERLDRQEAATREAAAKLDTIAAHLAALNQGLTLQERQLAVLEQLTLIATSTRERQDQANATLTAIAQTQHQAGEVIRQLVTGQDSRHRETLSTLAGLVAAANARQDQAQRDHNALRNALAAYLTPPKS
ncbi:MAG: hypothetical protein WCG36_04515 [bacterium]